MGRFVRQYDKDYMRMAILKQEETFREQVNELHRLYRVQRLLMQDANRVAELHARRQISRDGRRRQPATAVLDLEIPAGGDGCGNEEDAVQVELTLATGGSGSRASQRKKAESSESGSSASFSSSSSTDGSGTGCGGDTLDVRDWGLWYGSPVEEGKGVVAVAVRQERGDHRPSWQMQYLSLNMT